MLRRTSQADWQAVTMLDIIRSWWAQGAAPTGHAEEAPETDPGQLTTHFHVDELMCKDGTPVPPELLDNARAICQRAQVLRELLCRPLKVTSGYRPPHYNERIGGAKRSQHLTASALDLSCSRWSADELATQYEGLVRTGMVPDGGLGVYPRKWGGWIHIDLGRPRRWRG